ncbi:MAG: imidazole glycerol phosphate synthase subunit HisH [Planctomycetota bacterium]|nr:imidazole glycerol phosphate synthase subunit HisH [Planctomycetota bacterium]
MIAIIDYQMGNLRSVQRAVERAGYEGIVTDDPHALDRAEKIILPGVGAFADAMQQLDERNLIEPIQAAAKEGKPLLGICLGLQLLFDTSHENGCHRGLAIVAGEVVPFEGLPPSYKIPHMGWNQLETVKPSPLLEGIPHGANFYFVHSYYVVPEDTDIVVTRTDYHRPFVSMIGSKNIFATQFHPEKSQQLGLQMLCNFARLKS